jgi:starch synthase
MEFTPDVVHCHDWHTAFAPLYLRASPARTVLTIHNVGYQGIMPATAVNDLELGDAVSLLHQGDLAEGRINPLRHGILHASALTTVSPTHAQEICTPQYGMGLDDSLLSRGASLTGILNGIDTEEWNPATDRHVKHHFDARRLAGKKKAKQALLQRLELDLAPDAPLIGIVSRMAQQKGFDLLFEPMPRLLAQRDLRFVVLGNGDTRYEDFFFSLQQQFPRKVAFHRGYHEQLAHQIEAGSDMFLMPSQYEPCGLNQMYSLRYGTVPIVRRTGGLADSVQHFNPQTGAGTGVVFDDYDSPAVNWALNTALDWYQDRKLWQKIMRNGMAQDFSWDSQGARYVELYRQVVAGSQAAG